MNVEHERLKEILAEAAGKDTPEARAAYLEAACQGNAALRRQVEALLAAHGRAGDFLEQSVIPPAEAPIGEGPGTRIGRYKLQEKIGEGGFGAVFMAEQSEPVSRKVAIKIIKAGMDTREVIARFEAERQALALMDHPNIARVLDAGAAKTGRPYFVMELVNGIPITDYCDQKQLPTAERLQLFMKVCAAVQHAHQKGIIHRDLKPTNILVTLIDGEAVPKVIDFGVAKALGQKLTEKTLFTAFQHLIGTPAYMSPEQAELSGVDVDTRSDIYSLGVLLYELLTGVTPFDADTLRKAALDEIRRLIRETEPPKPSTRLQALVAADARRLQSKSEIGNRKPGIDGASSRRLLQIKETIRLVRGDLDWIVMKALEKDRARRYEAANALAEDVQRHLDHQPVRACPPGVVYRTRKFVRRHRMGVIVATSVTAALLAGLWLATFGFIRASRERNRALSAERLAETHRQRSETTLRRLEIRRVQELFAQDQAASGVALLALLLRENPSGRAMAEWLMNELTLRSFPLPMKPPLQHEDGVHLALFSPDGRHILTASRNSQARTWDALTGKPVAPPLSHDASQTRGSDFQGGLHPLHAAFSPDGRRVATGATDNTARIWDATTGQPLTPPLLHSNWVTYLSFSPDGQLLATACKDGNARLWNAMSGEMIGSSLRHSNWVNFVKFSPDGRFLATGSDDKSAQIWEVASAKPVTLPLQHRREVKDGAFSPDGQRFVTASGDNTAQLWDAGTGEPLSPPMQHESIVISVCFSPDGTRVATASFDKTVRLWDSYDGRAAAPPLHHQNQIRSVAFSPDGQRVATASQDNTARVWDAQTGTPLTEPMRHRGPVWSAVFSPDGRQVLTASSDKTARLWDVRPGQALGHALLHNGRVLRAQWSPDGRRILAVSGRSGVWETDTGRGPDVEIQALWDQLSILSAEFSPDGQRIVTAHEDGTARVWDGWGLRALTRRMRHVGPVHYAEFSPDGRLIATASADGAARLWDSENAAPRGSPLRHDDAVLGARFSGDGKTLVTASADKTARLWSVATGKLIATLPHRDQALGAQFSPDGQWVVTASSDHTAQVWKVVSGQPLGPPLRHQAPVTSAQFSPDGQWVVTASEDETARVWETRTGRPVGEPMRHKARINRAVFCPEGKRVLTASSDGTAGLWDALTGMPLNSPLKHNNNVARAAFSPDGHWIVTSCYDLFARIWAVTKVNRAPPLWLPEFAEAVVGERVNADHTAENVPPTEFFRFKEHLATAADDDEYPRWASWFLGDRSTRAVAPGARRTVPEFAEDLLVPWRLWLRPRDYLERFAEVTRLAPTNSEVFAQRAYLMARFQFTNALRQLPTLAWLSDRAVSLGPEQSMSWTARAHYLALAGQTNAAFAAFERGRPFASKDPLFWVALGNLHEQSGQLEEAYQMFTNAAGVAANAWPLAKAKRIAEESQAVLDRHPELRGRHQPIILVRTDLGTSRAPNCPPRCLDLDLPYTLDACWLGWEPTQADLRALPHGCTVLDGVPFDLHGLLQLGSSGPEFLKLGYPKATTIPVKQRCRRLHFLHATDLPETDATPVAAYLIRYADGQQREVPALYGRDIQAWLLEEDPPAQQPPIVAWRNNAGGGITLQLCRFTWENPRPDVTIERLDFISKMTQAAPFLVAITTEP